jgi:hypothetical protein
MSSPKRKIPRKGGRKPKQARLYSFKLADAVAEYYRKLGEGNMTLGIERATQLQRTAE